MAQYKLSLEHSRFCRPGKPFNGLCRISVDTFASNACGIGARQVVKAAPAYPHRVVEPTLQLAPTADVNPAPGARAALFEPPVSKSGPRCPSPDLLDIIKSAVSKALSQKRRYVTTVTYRILQLGYNSLSAQILESSRGCSSAKGDRVRVVDAGGAVGNVSSVSFK
jgi:hypothetical protein